MPLSGTITFEDCKTLSDVEMAIDEAKRSIMKGCTSGGDSNDDGSYTIDVNGEEDPPEPDWPVGTRVRLTDGLTNDGDLSVGTPAGTLGTVTKATWESRNEQYGYTLNTDDRQEWEMTFDDMTECTEKITDPAPA